MAQRVGRSIALLFHDCGTRRGWVVSSTPCRTLPPGKTRFPFYRRLCGPQGRPEQAENLVPTGIRSRTVQPVVSRYTDWANRSTREHLYKMKNCKIYVRSHKYTSNIYRGLFDMIVGSLTTCHIQYTWGRSICVFFYLTEQHSTFLLHTLQVLYIYTLCDSTNTNTIIVFVPNFLLACQQWRFQWWLRFVPSVPRYLRE